MTLRNLTMESALPGCEYMYYDNNALVVTDEQKMIHTFDIPLFSEKFSDLTLDSALLLSKLYSDNSEKINLGTDAFNTFNALPKPIKKNLIQNDKINF